jgi:uncharacterized protein YerC
MSKSIRSKVNIEIEEKSWSNFLSRLKKTPSSKKTEIIFNALLSPEEKIVLARRLAVVLLLKQGKSYTEISQILGVAPQTISAVKKSISKKFYNPYKKVPKKISPLPGRSFFDELADTLSRFPTYKGKGRWRFLDRR